MIKITYYTEQVDQEGEKYKLIKADDFLPLIPGNVLIEARIHYIPINCPGQI
jgi:hypothetical protein